MAAGILQGQFRFANAPHAHHRSNGHLGRLLKLLVQALKIRFPANEMAGSFSAGDIVGGR
jgi:hypothetical protein